MVDVAVMVVAKASGDKLVVVAVDVVRLLVLRNRCCGWWVVVG